MSTLCRQSLTLTQVTTADPVNDRGGNVTGNGFASFLLGDVDSAERSYAPMTKLRNFYIAPYFQDNIKITPRFTLNLGTPLGSGVSVLERQPSQSTCFFQSARFQIRTPLDPATGQPRLGAMAILGKNCNGCVGWDHPDMQWRHFSPRLGFAYQLNSKTVLLAGMSFSFLNTGAFEYGTNQVAVNFGKPLGWQFHSWRVTDRFPDWPVGHHPASLACQALVLSGYVRHQSQ